MNSLIQKIRHSLALRLLLTFFLTLVVVAAIFMVFFGKGFKHQFDEVLMPHVRQYHRYTLEHLGNPPSREIAKQIASETPIDIYIHGPNGEWSTNGRKLDPSKLDIRERDHHERRRVQKVRYGDELLLKAKRGKYEIYLSFPRGFRDYRRPGAAVLLLMVILTLTYLWIRRLFSPVKTIKEGVQKIGQGELGHRIVVERKDELGELADQINDMAEDIEGMLEAKRELLLAISHELRSPITRSKVSVELLDDSTVAQAIRRDLNAMESLISELLESERLNQRHVVLERSMVDLETVIQEAIEQHKSDGETRLSVSGECLPLCVDRARFKLLVNNLLGNAHRHNRSDQGSVSIALDCRKAHLELSVSDHGEGIDQEHLAHLTEPFYRADPSRQRKTGGYGLGLYLCQAIARAHGGELNIASQVGLGTTVSVKLPRDSSTCQD